MIKALQIIIGFLLLAGTIQATPLPDNPYFKAMQDEMKRSMSKLRRPGVEKPYFIAYKLEQITWGEPAEASLGTLYPSKKRDSKLNAYVWVDIGNAQKDSLGHRHAAFYAPFAYRPRIGANLPKSYKGVRQSLWLLTDQAYTFAAETYQQKQAYERSKQTNTKDKLPDVLPVKQATYIEEITSLSSLDAASLQSWVKEQSAQAKNLSFIEQFEVGVYPVQKDTYYLNSSKGFYQKSITAVQVEWKAKMRDQNGFKRTYKRSLWLPNFSPENQDFAATFTQGFVQDLHAFYNTHEGENYVGPVLLMPGAAGPFIYDQLVQNFQNLKMLTSEGNEEDSTAGKFNLEGQRVMAPGITVWEEPLARTRGAVPLGGFTPVDDEGVASQTLKLVEQGHVTDIPRTTRPLKGKNPSNGHALITPQSMPRERLTNVRLEPQEPLAWDELMSRFLQRCKTLGLDYGYVMHEWPTASNNNTPVLEKVYADGKSQFVHGLKIDGLTTRSLRDILAAGDSPVVTHIEVPGEVGLPAQNVYTPALLIEELELVPDDIKPDKPPFVKKP